MYITEEELRLSTIEFLMKFLVTRLLSDNMNDDLTRDMEGALERFSLPFNKGEVEQTELRAKMRVQALGMLAWAMDTEGKAYPAVRGRPGPVSRYDDW